MVRKPDHINRKKRIKTIILSEKAFIIWKELRKNKSWDFSDYVSKKLVDDFEFSDNVSFYKNEILRLKKERESIKNDFDTRIHALVLKLESLYSVEKEVYCYEF